jgi:hypothetical protein
MIHFSMAPCRRQYLKVGWVGLGKQSITSAR